jgi:hypothetical protein
MKRRPGARQVRAVAKAAPAVERESRREGVYAGAQALSRVFSEIREDVHERGAHLAWRHELAAVPAVGPETAAAPHEVVHVAGDADDETSDARGQGSLVARLDDEVHVVPLNRKVKHAKAAGVSQRGAANRQTNGGKHVLAA